MNRFVKFMLMLMVLSVLQISLNDFGYVNAYAKGAGEEEINGAAKWYDDYYYELDSDSGTITLKQYIGEAKNIVVPGNAIIDGVTYKTKLYSGAFYNCEGLKSISFENGVIAPNDMSYMFYGCSGLTSLDLSPLKTENVTDMGNMFAECSGLTMIKTPSKMGSPESDAKLPCEVMYDASGNEYTYLSKAPTNTVLRSNVNDFTEEERKGSTSSSSKDSSSSSDKDSSSTSSKDSSSSSGRDSSSSSSSKDSSSSSGKDSSSTSSKDSSSSSGKDSSSSSSDKDSSSTSDKDSSSTSSKDSGSSSGKDSSSSSSGTVSVDRVPLVSGTDFYSSSKDNFASVSTAGKITKMILDFTKVDTSTVAPDKLSMTVIKGSKFTVENVKTATGSGVKVKVKKGKATVTAKASGQVEFEMNDGKKYVVKFTVEAPKAQKSAKTMAIDATASKTLTIKDMFGTDIDGGKLSVVKEKVSGQAVVDSSNNTLKVTPKEKDTIKVQYQYLNKKYKLTIKVK